MIGIEEIFAQWEQMGLYSFILPFLLVFAIVYGITSSVKIFGDNKGVHVIISIVVGLLAVAGPSRGLLQGFFQEAFPRFGIGLAVLLMIVILIGIFIPETDTRLYSRILLGVGAVIAVVVLVKASASLGWVSGYSENSFIPWIVLAVIFIGIIIAVVAAQGPETATPDDKSGPKFKLVPG